MFLKNCEKIQYHILSRLFQSSSRVFLLTEVHLIYKAKFFYKEMAVKFWYPASLNTFEIFLNIFDI